MKNYLIVTAIIIFSASFSFSQQFTAKDMSCEESFNLILANRNNPDFVIIDVRTKQMFDAEHIENAIQSDVFSGDFDALINKLDKNKTYLIYCNIGQRSRVAVKKMEALNFKFLYHMYEGLIKWKGKGFSTVKLKSEIEQVREVINNVFGWAVNKDFNLFFNTISDDSNFISVTPYKRVKFGVQDVKNDTSFWASPNFKAIRHELYDLKINFSLNGDVAWFYCILDDINTWKGEPANWEKIRWTGVLEKRNGKWRVVQQHFSWPKEN